MGDFRTRVVTIVGTRPEIIKCSPLIPLLDDVTDQTLIHTGQHYDDNMDRQFFRDLELRDPDHNLAVGSGNQATQLAEMMRRLEPVLLAIQPDWVIVQGDTNSTLAGGLTAAKLGIPVAHIEAGCRSFNRSMPEEINRIVVDHLATICFAPDQTSLTHLASEGIDRSRVDLTGSTGIDACLRMARLIQADSPPSNLTGRYLLATIHRAENTEPERLAELVGALDELAETLPVVFPVHPRTAAVLKHLPQPNNVQLIDPVGYRTMISLLGNCLALLTDSGGLQEEAAVLGVPTFILRRETEWMEFVEAGHHRLAGTQRSTIVNLVRSTLADPVQCAIMRQPIGTERAGAAQRIVEYLAPHSQVDRDRAKERTWRSPATA